MLRNYSAIYQLAVRLGELKHTANLMKGHEVSSASAAELQSILSDLKGECLDHGFIYSAEMVERIAGRPPPEKYSEMLSDLIHLDGSLQSELKKESVFHIPPERKDYFENKELFGPKVAIAFPSCARDIERAGTCYALEQEDACVHHLMMVLERGLRALAARVGVQFSHANWQTMIDQIAKEVKSLPRGTEREFYTKANSAFEFLKNAYRNYSEHAHDDPYDMEKARSILNNTKAFMQDLEKGSLKE